MSRQKNFTLDDGTTMTAGELSRIAGISHYAALSRLRRYGTMEDLLRNTIPAGEKVYSRDGISITANEILEKVPGLEMRAACTRARRWEIGEAEYETLFWPKGKRSKPKRPVRRERGDTRNKGNAEWQALGNTPRNYPEI